jgi:hypothetical protein
MSHYRRPNPETKVVVGYGLVAVAVGILGWFGYKAYADSSKAAASGVLAPLPPFDASSTDTDHAYMIAVFTSLPVQGPIPAEGSPVTPYLGTLSVDHLVVTGPFSQKSQPPPPMDPTPDVILAVSLAGNIVGGMTKEQADKLKMMLGV